MLSRGHPCGCANVNCCSACDDCAASSPPKPIVGKPNAMWWMKRIMGDKSNSGGAAEATGGAFFGSAMSAMGCFFPEP